MLKTFTCGTFPDEEEYEVYYKSSDFKRSKSHGKSSKNNNPYSSRGRDKFSALLADLDERRKKIYSETTNPHDISLVRFVYTEKDDIAPVVIKAKNRDQRKHKSEELVKLRPAAPVDNIKAAIESSSGVEEYSRRRYSNAESDRRKAEKTRITWNNMWRRPSVYLPVVMILILVFLVVFGRSAATVCTCIVWYIVPILPTMNKESLKSSKSAKKKEYVRGMSEKKMENNRMGSPTPIAKPPGKHGHRKSW